MHCIYQNLDNIYSAKRDLSECTYPRSYLLKVYNTFFCNNYVSPEPRYS